MKNDFVAEILRATGTLQSGDPSGATAIIRAALAAGGVSPPAQPDAFTAPPMGMPQDLGASAGPRLRKPLGEALRVLTEGRTAAQARHVPGGRPVAEPLLPPGAEFRNLTHACPGGARRYRLYVPASAAKGVQGLVVMLHGCTQNPEDFAAGTGMNTLAEAHRLLVVYPGQTSSDNAMSCWNWFRPEDQRRDAGEPAIIADLTKTIRAEFDVPHDRVFVAGLSAGGAMAAIMAETYPELYAGVGIHSGLAYGAANDVMSAFSAMRGQGAIPSRRPQGRPSPRVIVFHGSADSTVHPSNADRIINGMGLGDVKTARHHNASTDGKRSYTTLKGEGGSFECWIIEGAEHAWAGGSTAGSYTDPQGPDASAAMVRFFLGGSSDAAL